MLEGCKKASIGFPRLYGPCGSGPGSRVESMTVPGVQQGVSLRRGAVPGPCLLE